jgi:putative spermidine/putrescine transport system ATP-binding protein
MSPAPPMRGARLEVRGLCKSFGGAHVVDDVSFEVDGGGFLTLLGPSGSGKTTTLRMIAGFEEPTRGRILVGGEDIGDRTPQRRNIGVVFQQYALFPHLTVFQNVAYPLQMRRITKRDIAGRVARTLELVRLTGLEGRYPKQLSGGQQQRVALARAIVFEPPLLLMDEPLGALDKRLRELMQIEVRHLQRQLGITTVSVTHDQVEALLMSDIIAVLDGGRLQQIGPPLEVYRRPANQFVSDFIGESNLLSGSVESGGENSLFTSSNGLCVRLPAGEANGAVHLVVRPEYLRLGDAAEAMGNRYRAEVLEVLYVGDLVRYRLRVEERDELMAKALGSHDALSWRTGSSVVVGWDPNDCLTVNS